MNKLIQKNAFKAAKTITKGRKGDSPADRSSAAGKPIGGQSAEQFCGREADRVAAGKLIEGVTKEWEGKWQERLKNTFGKKVGVWAK